jgi:hypothetical protein
VAVVVAVTGVIFVGQGHDHDDVDVYDHPSWLQVGGESILERRLFLLPSATSLRFS